jgi:DNA-binding XRE family transcriptional regulator
LRGSNEICEFAKLVAKLRERLALGVNKSCGLIAATKRLKMIDQNLLYKIIGERLRKARFQSGISQSDLAAGIRHLRTSIVNIEGGHQRAPLHVLYELCHHLRIQLISILPLEEEVRKDSLVSVNAGEVVQELPGRAAEALQEILRKEPNYPR